LSASLLQTFVLRRARSRLERWRKEIEGEFQTLRKVVIRVRTYAPRGSSRGTIVIIPDPPNLVEHHADLIQELRRDYRIVGLELPGFGYSHPLPGFSFTLDEQVAALSEVLDRLNVRNAILEMSCLGAFVGIQLAQRRPDLIRGLVLQQVPSYAEARRWARRADVAGLIATPWVGQILVQLGAKTIAKHWYRAALPASTDPETCRQYTAPTVASLERGACFALASAYQTLLTGPLLAPAKLIQPVLALWGDADGTHSSTDRASILRQVTPAELVTFEGCGHFPGLEAPQRYLALLRDFCATCAERAAAK